MYIVSNITTETDHGLSFEMYVSNVLIYLLFAYNVSYLSHKFQSKCVCVSLSPLILSQPYKLANLMKGLIRFEIHPEIEFLHKLVSIEQTTLKRYRGEMW